jgi:hypothetical protein
MLKKASFKIVVAFKYGKNSRLRSYDHRFSHVQNSSHAAMNGLLCRSLGHMASFLVGTVMARSIEKERRTSAIALVFPTLAWRLLSLFAWLYISLDLYSMRKTLLGFYETLFDVCVSTLIHIC